MVGMCVALVVVVTVLAFLMVGAKSPCEDVDPAIRNFTHDFTNDSCLYIRKEDKDWEGARTECESLGQYPLKWRLVELKTESLQNAVDRILAGKLGKQYYSFWIGLVRQQANDSSDVFNRSAWANPSKWRWLSDDSTLLSWSNDSQVPWYAYGNEPDGWRASWPADLCVQVQREPPSSYWFDGSCSGRTMSMFVVCESMDVSTITTSTTTTTATDPEATSPTDPETNSSCPCLCPTTPVPSESEMSPWMWVSIVLAIVMVAAVVGYLVYRAYQHHKRQPFMLSADSDQSGTYENMPRFKGKRRPMKKDDESESESLDTSRGSKKKRLGSKKPKLSWMIDRKDGPKSPVMVLPKGKASVPKEPKEKPSRSLWRQL